MKKTIRDIDDIRERCEISPAGCWIWRCGYTTDKHGSSRPKCWDAAGRRMIGVCRLVLLFEGITPGEMVWSRCKTHGCVRPDHIRTGTAAEYGRFIKQIGALKGNELRTQINIRIARERNAKLTLEQAREIRASGLKQIEAAKKYGCSQSTISKRMLGQSWREPEPKVTRCRSITYDPRYQVAPGERPAGAGFARLGVGRYLEE
jgi:Helix-turn-helix